MEKKEAKHFWEREQKKEANKLGSVIQKHTVGNVERVATGIDGLDKIIEGGLKRGSVVLVEGGAGTGKTIFALQFLLNGVEYFGENGVYISFEEEKKEFFGNMKRFGWDLEKLEEESKFAFLRYNPEQVEKILSGGGGLVRDVVEKVNAKRIVIDSMTAFTMLHDAELARREATLDLFKTIKKWKCTTLVVGQPGYSDSEVESHPFNMLEFECDGVIRLYNVREHNLRTRTIEVFKMRGTKHASKTFTMEITDEGIVIYPDGASI